MQIREKKYNYLANNQVFSFREKLQNGVQINVYVALQSEKFLEYQKDLLQDFLADFVDKANTDIYDETDLKNNLEQGLQALNVKLKLFADKVSDVDHFTVKGYIQIVAGNMLISSMIGDTSVLILRDSRVYYQLHNGVSKKAKIDVFSDFVEGDIETGDEIVYVGTKVSDVLDSTDIREIQDSVSFEGAAFVELFEKAITSRMEKENIGLISDYIISGAVLQSSTTSSLSSKIKKIHINTDFVKRFSSNKYYLAIFGLSIIVLFMLYGVLSEFFNTKPGDVFTTESGTVIDITIDDIKQDIATFNLMDVKSNEKAVKYGEIIEKLSLLESKGKWTEDVEVLKSQVENEYYKGFNIIRLDSLSQFDIGIKTRLISFNNTEKSKMGDLLFLDFQRALNIGGTKGALIGAINDGSRGGIVEFGIDSNMAGCSTNLLRDGLYCYVPDGRIYNITKAGIEPLTTVDGLGFPDTVGGIGVYGKANFYVFQPNLNSSLKGIFLSRYRNTVGSQTVYQAGQNYSLISGYDQGVSFNGDFQGTVIDSTFLTWNNGKLYQLWRPGNGSSLDVREIKILGGDSSINKYSDDVKVIASFQSKYVYLFDRINKTFGIYSSAPSKANDASNTRYTLQYLFSFKFALTSEQVLDIAIPESTANRPEMYILTNQGINKINLYEFIDSVEGENVLKDVLGSSASNSSDIVGNTGTN